MKEYLLYKIQNIVPSGLMNIGCVISSVQTIQLFEPILASYSHVQHFHLVKDRKIHFSNHNQVQGYLFDGGGFL